MSRTLSSESIAAMFAPETDEVFLVLITVDHDELSEPLRVSSDSVDTTSRGDLFIAYPFKIALPSDDESAPPVAQVTIDNISKVIVDSLRSISSPATFKIEIIRAADPDTVEIVFDQFLLKNVRGDVFQITGDLTIESVMTEPFPYRIFSPAEFRGLFA